MDPLAHTLIGATLAETRLKKWSAMATPMLILGANAPDIDAITMFMDRDLSLGFRRGLTHGILAMVVLPVLLTGLLLLTDRITAKIRKPYPHCPCRPTSRAGHHRGVVPPTSRLAQHLRRAIFDAF